MKTNFLALGSLMLSTFFLSFTTKTNSYDTTTNFTPLVGQVYVNEVMASNRNSLKDDLGKSSDWIEIYNGTSAPLDLAGYYITDNPNNLKKFRFPETPNQVVIPAYGYKIIWASGENLPGHTTWSLSASGEHVVLTAPDGVTVIDAFQFPEQKTDISYGRHPLNLDSLVFFSPSSPGQANLVQHAYKGFLNPPTISHNGGLGY